MLRCDDEILNTLETTLINSLDKKLTEKNN